MSDDFLKNDSVRKTGRSAVESNILIAKLVANSVKSTLGPKGMDKMIVDNIGDCIVSNDGATILREMSMGHPIGRMLVDLAVAQESSVGDGTTSVVVLAGALLEEAEKLLADGIHPSVIIKGFEIGLNKCVCDLRGLGSVDFDLNLVAKTSMTGKVGAGVDGLSKLVVDGIKKIDSRDDVLVVKKVGGSVEDSFLVNGVVVDKGVVDSRMPKSLSSVKVGFLKGGLVNRKKDGVSFDLSSHSELSALLDAEESELVGLVNSVVSSGVNVVFCTGEVNDFVVNRLARAGVLVVRNVRVFELEALVKSCGGEIVSSVSDFDSCFGVADRVFEKKFGDDKVVIVEGVDKLVVSFVVCGSTSHVVDEVARAVDDAVGSVFSCLHSEFGVVPGAGYVDMKLSSGLRSFASSVSGREQLGVVGFANALEVIPRVLSVSCGLNSLDAVVELRSKVEDCVVGVNVVDSCVGVVDNVFEPVSVKESVLRNAVEVVEMILRIDDVILGVGDDSSSVGG